MSQVDMNVQAAVQLLALGYELRWYIDSPDAIRCEVFRISDPTCISYEGVLLGSNVFVRSTLNKETEEIENDFTFSARAKIEGQNFGIFVMKEHKKSLELASTLKQILA